MLQRAMALQLPATCLNCGHVVACCVRPWLCALLLGWLAMQAPQLLLLLLLLLLVQCQPSTVLLWPAHEVTAVFVAACQQA